MEDEEILKTFFTSYRIVGRNGDDGPEYYVDDSNLPAGEFLIGPFSNYEAAQIARIKILVKMIRDNDAANSANSQKRFDTPVRSKDSN